MKQNNKISSYFILLVLNCYVNKFIWIETEITMIWNKHFVRAVYDKFEKIRNIQLILEINKRPQN